MCLKWDFFGIEWNCATICKQLQIRIISENIFSLILMVYRHRKLGSPERKFVATEHIKTRTMLDINFIMRAVNYISIIQ